MLATVTEERRDFDIVQREDFWTTVFVYTHCCDHVSPLEFALIVMRIKFGRDHREPSAKRKRSNGPLRHVNWRH